MFDSILSHLDVINFTLVIFTAIIFFVGYTLAPTVYFNKIQFLLAYPMWLNNKLEKWIEDKKLSMLAFTAMFILNTLFLALALVSGLVPFLPFILLLWMGINIGVITYHTLKGNFYYSYLLTPIALLELAAIFITFTMAINLNLYRLDVNAIADFIKPVSDMSRYWDTFGMIVLPLLLLAGFIEIFLIRLSKKFTDEDDKE